MKVASLVGTRPQFLKLSPLCDYVNAAESKIDHVVIHSGQHYDASMSNDIFSQLDITTPIKTIERLSGSNSMNFGHMMAEVGNTINEHGVDRLIVFGDCDTTLAGAMAARRLNVPVVHVEAGMRSFNRRMPEEVNRVLTDNISDILLCPDQHSIERLHLEGIHNNTHLVGNLQIELLRSVMDLEDSQQYEFKYSLLTIHRDYNTVPAKIKNFFDELKDVDMHFIFPAHPRTSKIISEHNIKVPDNVHIKGPFSYLHTLQHLNGCEYVVTDSGGLQLESWYLGKKCLVLRTETEWIDAVRSGNSMLCNNGTPRVSECIDLLINQPTVNCYDLPLNTSELIFKHILPSGRCRRVDVI